MNKSTVFLSTALCLMSLSATAKNPAVIAVTQQANVCKGIVKDASGQPVIGASVSVKGAKSGAITDVNGNFTLNNIKGGVLLKSHVLVMNQWRYNIMVRH